MSSAKTVVEAARQALADSLADMQCAVSAGETISRDLAFEACKLADATLNEPLAYLVRQCIEDGLSSSSGLVAVTMLRLAEKLVAEAGEQQEAIQ